MASFKTDYRFEELQLAGDALMAWGTATLASSGEEYPGEFYVSEIKLDNGLVLRPKGVGNMGAPDTFRAELFNRIAAILEADDAVQTAYAEAEEGDDDVVKPVNVSAMYGTYSATNGHAA